LKLSRENNDRILRHGGPPAQLQVQLGLQTIGKHMFFMQKENLSQLKKTIYDIFTKG